MNTVNKPENKDNAVNSDNAETREEIKTLNVNMARLKQDIPSIIREEIRIQFSMILQKIGSIDEHRRMKYANYQNRGW